MNNRELFYFAARCLMLDDQPEFRQEVISKISADVIDWAKFVTLCSNHLILPVIYLKFKRNQILGLLDQELADFLKEIYEIGRAHV